MYSQPLFLAFVNKTFGSYYTFGPRNKLLNVTTKSLVASTKNLVARKKKIGCHKQRFGCHKKRR